MEKDKKVVFLEKQLKEKKVARNQSEIGASAVHFHDFNAEVLRCLTIPNVNASRKRRSPTCW
ncbi:hypothetical protein NC653_037799 [Populus alba x Populus x berolinensis]|uniref:Uncharacterized protein n=1 Tax=Populus alba x Populus x berolinensis TaxID=444605 RepID=A0AAD6PSC9_9ROSI|nr:hypothetical protein NC653_037799 [Populus alba x Populus x berolinensis]